MFTKKRIRLPNGVRVKISRHFDYGFFGVRGRYDTVSRTGVYVNNKQPGTGFFVHDMDSRSYRHFVRAEKKKLEQDFWTLLFRREPSFAREIKRTEKALDMPESGKVQKQILSQYLNVSYLAQEEEFNQRIVRGLKNKIGHRRTEKANYFTSILTNYKSRIATLSHDVRGTQLNIREMMPEETLAAWKKVVDAFLELVDVRRLWHVVDDRYEQVFFDLGIFDYIQSPFDTPMLRDSQGGLYFLYPQGVVRYRTNLDFDFIPLKEITFTGGAVDLSMLSAAANASSRKSRDRKDAMGQLYATTTRGVNAVGQLACPTLGLTFCCNHIKPVMHFAEAFNEFKALGIELDFSLLEGGGKRTKKLTDEVETVQTKAHL